jgi:hypothetical protein
MNSPYSTPFGKDFPLDAREHATIGNVRNFSLASNQYYHFSQKVQNHARGLVQLITGDKLITYIELEELLRKEYGTEEIIVGDKRVSPGLALADTYVARKADIIITVGRVPTNNMGANVVDPLGFLSRNWAPTATYWLLWKAPELRPSSNEFDKELYDRVMHTRADIQWLMGFAIETWGKDKEGNEETVIMPIFTMTGWMDLIKQFSHEKPEDAIPTAKWILANQ